MPPIVWIRFDVWSSSVFLRKDLKLAALVIAFRHRLLRPLADYCESVRSVTSPNCPVRRRHAPRWREGAAVQSMQGPAVRGQPIIRLEVSGKPMRCWSHTFATNFWLHAREQSGANWPSQLGLVGVCPVVKQEAGHLQEGCSSIII